MAKEPVLKTGAPEGACGFESHLLRIGKKYIKTGVPGLLSGVVSEWI